MIPREVADMIKALMKAGLQEGRATSLAWEFYEMFQRD